MPRPFELDIEFLTRPRADKDHPRHRQLRPLERKLKRVGFDFRIYQELFERYVAEGLIATGGADGSGRKRCLVDVREITIGPKSPSEINHVEEALGSHPRQEARYLNLSNFFEHYDRTGPQLFFQNKVYLETLYFKNEILPHSRMLYKSSVRLLSALIREDPLERIARERVAMLENFRNSGGRLVANGKSIRPGNCLRYFDLPWAIDYFGYVKERDGAHRRATLHYLGEHSIPTLVLNFSRIDLESCETTTNNKLIAANFSRFRAMVQDIVKSDYRS